MFAYVPARGGSKRVPGKNVRELGGKPVVGHVIETLKALPFITEVFISTDDAAIAEVATGYGAAWLGPRSAELSNDKAGFVDLIHHDIPRHAEKAGGDTEVLFVLALAALVPPTVYRAAHDVWLQDRPNLLMSVVPCYKSPYWALVPGEGGFLTPLFREWVYVNSQDLPPAYDDAGLFYMLDWQKMRAYDSHKVMDRLQAFVVDRSYAVDVDTEADWQQLEERYKQMKNANLRSGSMR